MNRQSVSLGLTWAAAFLLLGLALPLGLSRILAAPLAASGLPAPPYLLVLVLAAGGLGLLWTVWPSPAWAPPAWQPQTAKPVRVATRGQGWAIVPLLAGLGFLIEQANLRPLRADLLHREGELQAQFLNRVERAEQAFRQALELAPTQDHYHPALGELWLRQLAASKPGARAEALAAETRRLFEEACRLSPLDPDHPVNLGRFYQVWSEHAEGRAEQVRRLDLAAEQYGRALRLFPYAVWWWGEWAWIEHLRGEPARADRNLAHALALDETCLATWLVKGRLLLARHDSAGAISTLSQALRLSPSNIPAHFLLSLAYSQGGRADLAGASQQRAAQATGGQPQGILTLATWYARYGMREEALRLIRGGPKDAPPRIQAQLRSLQEELER